MEKVTLSFGGNALGITHSEQIKNAKFAAKFIVDVSLKNNVLVVTGNGPISGNLALGLDYANSQKITKSTYSLANIVAMTQGSIGSDFEIAIVSELLSRGIIKNVTCILTHVLVDENDPKFKDPSKPIGAFYTEDEAKILEKENNWVMKEDAGRGFRRVVASPLPIGIVEEDKIKRLIDIDNSIVICGVGGGIPVIKKESEYQLIDAVIDKDFTTAEIAKISNSSKMVILTEAKGVALNYGTEDEKWLSDISTSDVKELIDQNYFPDGSMGPKIKAAVKYAEESGNVAVIAKLADAQLASELRAGTIIKKG